MCVLEKCVLCISWPKKPNFYVSEESAKSTVLFCTKKPESKAKKCFWETTNFQTGVCVPCADSSLQQIGCFVKFDKENMNLRKKITLHAKLQIIEAFFLFL